MEMPEEGPHLEFALWWLELVLSWHGKCIREKRGEFEPEMRGAVKCVRIQDELARL